MYLKFRLCIISSLLYDAVSIDPTQCKDDDLIRSSWCNKNWQQINRNTGKKSAPVTLFAPYPI
jgi:hypothetical protein